MLGSRASTAAVLKKAWSRQKDKSTATEQSPWEGGNATATEFLAMKANHITRGKKINLRNNTGKTEFLSVDE